VQADSKRTAGTEYLRYARIQILRRFAPDHRLAAIEKGSVLFDSDARTGHNHGTKSRLRQDRLPDLYGEVIDVD
jgi:hypothetical protein